jgi:hypothetical protein
VAERGGVRRDIGFDDVMPWDAEALYRTIFPQLTNCLPDEEAAQLRFHFEVELARGLKPRKAISPGFRLCPTRATENGSD